MKGWRITLLSFPSQWTSWWSLDRLITGFVGFTAFSSAAWGILSINAYIVLQVEAFLLYRVTFMWVFTKKDLSWSVRERMPSMRCNWAIRSSVCCVAASLVSIVSIAKLIQTIVSSSSPPPQLINRSGKSNEFVEQYFTLSFRWRKSGAFEGNWGLNLKLNWAILTIEQKWLKWERLRKRKREAPQKERILWWIRSSLPRDIIINLFSRIAWWSFEKVLTMDIALHWFWNRLTLFGHID